MTQLAATDKYHLPLVSAQKPLPFSVRGFCFGLVFLSCAGDLQTAVLKLVRADKYRSHLLAGSVHRLVAEIPEQMIRGFFFLFF